MDNICRICASVNDKLLNIFEKPKTIGEPEKLSVAEMLIECVDCNVRLDDPFPKQICTNCLLTTQNAYDLKRKYEESHQYFCGLLENKEKNIQNDLGFEIIMDAVEITDIVDKLGEQDCYAVKGKQKTENNMMTLSVNENEELEPTYSCTFCGKTCISKRKLVLHKQEHVVNKQNECSYCLKLFENSKLLKEHVRLHLGLPKPYQCSTCLKNFAEKMYLNKHLRLVHMPRERNQPCPLCPMRFDRKKNLLKHIENHLSDCPFPCKICNSRFESQELLDLHQPIHNGENPYQCGDCDETFVRHDLLQHHAKRHANPRPFQCEHCTEGFYYREYLNKHIRLDCRNNPSLKKKVS